MPAAHAAEPADNDEPFLTSRTAARSGRDRHGRHEGRSGYQQAGPRRTVGPPKTVPMTAEEYRQAVAAWAALIASWWTDNPPDDNDDHHDH